MENKKALIATLYEMERCIKKCINLLESSEGKKLDVGGQDISIETKIRNFVRDIRIDPKYMGYNYIHTALKLVLEDENVLYTGIVKELYSQVAKIHNTSSGCAERCMRQAIIKSWENSKDDDYFWEKCPREHYPTNKEFFALARIVLIGE